MLHFSAIIMIISLCDIYNKTRNNLSVLATKIIGLITKNHFGHSSNPTCNTMKKKTFYRIKTDTCAIKKYILKLNKILYYATLFLFIYVTIPSHPFLQVPNCTLHPMDHEEIFIEMTEHLLFFHTILISAMMLSGYQRQLNFVSNSLNILKIMCKFGKTHYTSFSSAFIVIGM